MITFKDVENKYNCASECITDNAKYVFDDSSKVIVTNIDNSQRLDKSTLARWLFGSSQEFLADYQRTSAELRERTPDQDRLICEWNASLMTKVNVMRNGIKVKYAQHQNILEASK